MVITIHQKYRKVNDTIFDLIDYFINEFPNIKYLKTLKSTFRMLTAMCPSMPCKKILDICKPYHERIMLCDVDYLIENYQNIEFVKETIDEYNKLMEKEEIIPFIYKLRDLYICCCITKYKQMK